MVSAWREALDWARPSRVYKMVTGAIGGATDGVTIMWDADPLFALLQDILTEVTRIATDILAAMTELKAQVTTEFNTALVNKNAAFSSWQSAEDTYDDDPTQGNRNTANSRHRAYIIANVAFLKAQSKLAAIVGIETSIKALSDLLKKIVTDTKACITAADEMMDRNSFLLFVGQIQAVPGQQVLIGAMGDQLQLCMEKLLSVLKGLTKAKLKLYIESCLKETKTTQTYSYGFDPSGSVTLEVSIFSADLKKVSDDIVLLTQIDGTLITIKNMLISNDNLGYLIIIFQSPTNTRELTAVFTSLLALLSKTPVVLQDFKPVITALQEDLVDISNASYYEPEPLPGASSGDPPDSGADIDTESPFYIAAILKQKGDGEDALLLRWASYRAKLFIDINMAKIRTLQDAVVHLTQSIAWYNMTR